MHNIVRPNAMIKAIQQVWSSKFFLFCEGMPSWFQGLEKFVFLLLFKLIQFFPNIVNQDSKPIIYQGNAISSDFVISGITGLGSPINVY